MAGDKGGGDGERRLRQPIVVVLGHVDHGKTTLLDKIRRTAVAAKEAGGITQHIGASIVPADVIEKIAEPLKKVIPVKLVIPGLLFIDTPGHELFSNLRRRGGSVADFAILVVDIMEGFKPQTYEALELLKERRVPFLIAANKIDRIPGWKPNPDAPFIETIRRQDPKVREILEQRVYEIVGKMYEAGLPAELFTRIKDFRRKIAIVPVSARTGEGIPELLAVLAGLTQTYLKERLRYAEGPAKGVVLEVKEMQGFGTVVDAVIYDGVLKKEDIIVVGGREGPIVTRVRALLMPAPLQDIRSREARFVQVDRVYAAAGVRIAAPGLDDVIAGSPIYAAESEEEARKLMEAVQREIEELRFRTENIGVVVKADTLGTLEALVEALRRRGVPVRLADIGPVSRSDVLDAAVTRKIDPYLGVVLAFNVKVLPEAEEEASRAGVKIFRESMIYKLIEDYEEWVKKEKEAERLKALNSLIRPGKFRILPGYVFRRSDPAIVGVEVLGGVIRPGYPVMDSQGRELGRIMAIKDRDRSLEEARLGAAVAVSIQGRILIGRHANEGDILYTNVPAQHAYKILTEFKDLVSKDELDVLREIAEIKRRAADHEYNKVLLRLKIKRVSQ
ncbi:translation initiation factor IF-2 [Aeropyrum pernix K1]|uniref:Probable translation initiation factor IF-2 n=2 Tax=Aeropyrum pernix (strain ATCC 700893 / DSM 11879 / JCM 9820 / NBRC 100138 / K1) TaxID=272557 RepID=IF2P_AERPE|nr:translation initiation factor IF-2 [Aeropyrum pernix]Q9Y9B3.1 RecName: Full=Probable translation initiation factor IF-2 [Aeropyrum pernix K1]BAA81387.1 translation initiation factor IF-2 [Aeropyrum pernix K1]